MTAHSIHEPFGDYHEEFMNQQKIHHNPKPTTEGAQRAKTAVVSMGTHECPENA